MELLSLLVVDTILVTTAEAKLDFNALNIQALRKYRQAFKLNVKARSSKDELVLAASRHFNSHTVDEVDTIARFLYTVHSNKEKYPSVGY
ncbi:hypothetical protein H4R24_002347 [Coemansia sp. RSA 988]|nr:hypothetical protein H4R24_002347 [Coemansia sp. RSA 988]